MHQAQADRESRCSQHTWAGEHLSEVCDAAQCIRIGANPASRGQRSHWSLL